MMRAVRLVIDTGLHAKGWERQRAIDYFAENSAMSNTDISAEVDRYMVFPGQALSYKVGELKILALRRRAEDAFAASRRGGGGSGGGEFSAAAFHEVVLGSGALPLAALEEKVDAWLAVEAPPQPPPQPPLARKQVSTAL